MAPHELQQNSITDTDGAMQQLLHPRYLSPYTLKFSDKILERAYNQLAVSSSLSVDRAICFTKLWVSAVLFAAILAGSIESTPVGRILWLGYLCLLSGHLTFMQRAAVFYKSHRSCLIILMKLSTSAMLSAFVPTYIFQRVGSAKTYVEVVVLGGGLVMQLCTGVIMPVRWPHHVPLASATFAIYNFVMLRTLVEVLLCSSTATSITARLYSLLDDTAFTLSGLLMPYPMQRPDGAGSRAQAYILVLWLQMHLALFVPGCYLYCTESRSRWRFLCQAQQSDHQQQQQHLQDSQQQQHAAAVDHSAAHVSAVSTEMHTCGAFSDMQRAGRWQSQYVILGCCFLMLLALSTWNILHLCIELLMAALDHAAPHQLISWVASQHGLAGDCLK